MKFKSKQEEILYLKALVKMKECEINVIKEQYNFLHNMYIHVYAMNEYVKSDEFKSLNNTLKK